MRTQKQTSKLPYAQQHNRSNLLVILFVCTGMTLIPNSYAQSTKTTTQKKAVKLPLPKEYKIGGVKVSKIAYEQWEAETFIENEAAQSYVLGDYKSSIAIYNKIKNEHPSSVRYDVLADIYEKQGKIEKALQAYRIYVYDKSNGWDWVDAEGHSRAKEVQSLVPTGICSSRDLAIVFRYVVLLAKEGQIDEANHIFQLALNKFRDYHSDDELAQVVYDLESIRWSQNFSHLAKQLQAAAWVGYGANYTKIVFQIKDTLVEKIHVEAYQKAVDAEPDLALGQYMLGKYLYELNSDLNEASKADKDTIVSSLHAALTLSRGKLYERTKTLWAEISTQLEEIRQQNASDEQNL